LLQKSVKLRPYEERDRESVRRICCDTAFMGEKIDTVFRDRDIFADIIAEPYLRYEPEWTWVAESQGRIVGFLMSSVSRYFHVNRMRTSAPAVAKLIFKLNRGLYADHPRSERFARWLLFKSWKEKTSHPKGAAHMHYDIMKGFRSAGLGWVMWQTFERALKAQGKCHYYGKFFSWPGRNVERLYWLVDAHTFSRSRTTIFDQEIPELEMICMHKWISNH